MISLFKMDSCEKRVKSKTTNVRTTDHGSMVDVSLRDESPDDQGKIQWEVSQIFDFIGLQGTIEERAKAFAERGKKEPDLVFVSILRFAQVQKERVGMGVISPATLTKVVSRIHE
jgi:hypothetical protein